MSDPFDDGQASPTHVPAPRSMPKQDGSSPHTPSVPGLAIHPNPLPAETPTRAQPVMFTAPITPVKREPSAPREVRGGPGSPGYEQRVADYAAANPDLVQLADPNQPNPAPGMQPHMPPTQNPGTTEGRAVAADARSKVSTLFRVLSREGRGCSAATSRACLPR